MAAIRIIDSHLELADIGTNTHAQIDTHIAAADDYVKRDGSLALTADWDIGDTRKILADEIRARDGAGLKLYDDGGHGVFVKDGGSLEIENTTSATTGVIYKGADRFIHNFQHPTGGGAVPNGRNTFIGDLAGNFTTGSTATLAHHGSDNVGIGYATLASNTIGYYNMAIGYRSLYANTTGYRNMAIGYASLRLNTVGYENVGLGAEALYKNVAGMGNVAVGGQALYWTTGTGNLGIGQLSLHANTAGHYNIGIGSLALYNKATGGYNAAIGRNAGRYISGGGNNTNCSYDTLIGFDTRPLADGSTNEIVIGASTIGVGSNSVVLGNDSITKTILKGDIGLGITSPTAKLDINSDIFRLRTAKTPATAGAAGNQGDWCWDATHIYVCTATNTWKRAAIAAW